MPIKRLLTRSKHQREKHRRGGLGSNPVPPGKRKGKESQSGDTLSDAFHGGGGRPSGEKKSKENKFAPPNAKSRLTSSSRKKGSLSSKKKGGEKKRENLQRSG